MKENIKIIIPEEDYSIERVGHVVIANLEKTYNIELLVGLAMTVYALLVIIG